MSSTPPFKQPTQVDETFAGDSCLSEQAQKLAARFDEVRTAVTTVVSACTDDQWRMKPPGEDRTIGVIFHHIAAGYAVEIDLIKTVLNEDIVPFMYRDNAALDRWNGEYAEQYKDCSKVETLEALEQAGTVAAQFVRGLSDEQLRKTGHYPKLVSDFGAPPTVERLVNLLIDHPGWHLDDIKAVCYR